MFGEDSLVKQHKERADYVFYIIIFSFSIIISRLWFLQIFRGDEFYQYSLENILRKEVIRSSRGLIFDRNNKVLVRNLTRFDVIIIPQYLKDKKKTISRLSKIINISKKDIYKTLKKYRSLASFRPVVLKKNLTRKEVAIIETENFKLPGVSIRPFKSRHYPKVEIGAHLLGYISEISREQLPKYQKRDGTTYSQGDMIGQSGVEKSFDKYLRGESGYEYVQVDAFGRKKRGGLQKILGRIDDKEQTPGYHVRLTLDEKLQEVAYKALEGKVGAAVALNVENGEILAMVSRPSFDPKQFSIGLTKDYWRSLIENENNPLRNKAIQEHYAPGSTFKTITAIAALEEGLIDENTTINCKGSFRLGRRVYHCWKRGGHGKVNVYKSIKESCDVFYYKIAMNLDIDVLGHYANLFGFGYKSGIDLRRETSGLIPSKAWKKKKTGQPWIKGETLSCAIGQSFILSTPLQLARAYMAIANKGKIYKPQIVRDIFTNNGNIIKHFKPKLTNEIEISEKTLAIVKESLYKAVNERGGTAFWHKGKGITMSGKTGTSQVISFSKDQIYSKCEKKEFKFRHHGVFAAYAPFKNPKIAVAVIVEHGCHGSSAASPVAEKIISKYMNDYYPELIIKKVKKVKIFKKIEKVKKVKM